jgi:S-formylglutathione hydrolase FrmB
MRLLTCIAVFLTTLPASMLGEPATPPVRDPQTGVWQFDLTSPRQTGPAKVEVLLPDSPAAGKRYPVLFILPVEPGSSRKFGDGLEEARKMDLANRHQVICVAPSFTTVPWFGNHADNPQIRQDDYMVEDLVPAIDRLFPTTADKEGRWLIGFSKSGWGAYTLLLRHPDVFGYAAAWDAPFMINGENTGADWGPMGIKRVFGRKEALLAFLPTRLVETNAELLRQRCRLVLAPGIFWQAQVEAMHALLLKANIPHHYDDSLLKPHRWDTGWFPPLVDELVGIAHAKAP